VVDAGEIVLDLSMIEAFNLAIELIEKAGSVAAGITGGGAAPPGPPPEHRGGAVDTLASTESSREGRARG
jgi:hypothetical protein